VAKETPAWVVVDDDQKVRKLGERKLRRMIREHDLDGHELVRGVSEPESALRPLHTLPAYHQVHGVGPDEAEAVAHAQRVRGFAYHLAAFLGVMALVGPAFWFAFWGIGLFAHFSRVARSVEYLRERGNPLAAVFGFAGKRAAVSAPSSTPAPSRAKSPSAEPAAADPLGVSVRREWEKAQARIEDGDAAATLREAWGGVEQAVVRRQTLLATLDGESEDELTAELARLDAEMAAVDAVTAEVLERSRRAVEARLAALQSARTAEVRLRARIDAMLHQLKAVNLTLAARTDPAPADLEAQVGALRDEARAAAELEEALAEARAPESRRGRQKV
jgi:hypothetical protein